MNYEKAYQELDQIFTATNNQNQKDTVFINGKPLATTTYGEALRPLIREEAVFAMEDYGMSALEAAKYIAAKLQSATDGELGWWKQNGWLKEVIKNE